MCRCILTIAKIVYLAYGIVLGITIATVHSDLHVFELRTARRHVSPVTIAIHGHNILGYPWTLDVGQASDKSKVVQLSSLWGWVYFGKSETHVIMYVTVVILYCGTGTGV